MPKSHTSTGAVAVLSIASFIAASLASYATPEYTLTDLGTLGGNQSFANGINASGQVIGFSYLADNVTSHAFLYDSALTDVSPKGTVIDQAVGINSWGQFVGNHTLSTSNLYTAYSNLLGVSTDLAMIGAGTRTAISSAQAINDAGDITGVYPTGAVDGNNPIQHAFFYRNETLTDLGALGGNFSIGYGLNSHGDVVGSATLSTGKKHAFLYSEGHMTDLGTFGGTEAFAAAINDAGVIVGGSYPGTSHPVAFSYNHGLLVSLGTLGGVESGAASINNRGQIVGYSLDTSSSVTAFIEKDGTMVNLNTLIDPAPNFYLYGASSINDFGQIVGSGYPNGSTGQHGYRLTPIEPQLGVNGLTTVARSSGGIHLLWKATPGAATYTIFRSETSNGPQTSLGTVTSPAFDDKQTQGGKTYTYVVVATNATGAKLKSAPVSALNPALPPAAAVVTATTVSTSEIKLTWAPVPNATIYVVYRSTVSGTGRTVIGSTTTGTAYLDASLHPSTRYYYVVTSGNANGWTNGSEVSAITRGLPGAPQVTAAPTSASEINLTWPAVDGAKTYTIYRSTVSGTGRTIIAQLTTATSFYDHPLHASTRYYYVVTAGNPDGFTNGPEVSAATPAK